MINNSHALQQLASDRALYCIWIRAHEGADAPLVAVWMDPPMRAFQADTQEIKRGADGPKGTPEHLTLVLQKRTLATNGRESFDDRPAFLGISGVCEASAGVCPGRG